ncbi:MAG: hypothetical protein AAF662_02235 [Pseudomonadota bacterium]
MPNRVDVAKIDLQLDIVQGTHIHLCAGEPSDYADVLTRQLATQTIVGAQNKAAGDTSGRKLTTPQQVDVPISAGGDADHCAHTDGSGDLKRVHALASTLTLVAGPGATVTINQHEHEIGATS